MLHAIVERVVVMQIVVRQAVVLLVVMLHTVVEQVVVIQIVVRQDKLLGCRVACRSRPDSGALMTIG